MPRAGAPAFEGVEPRVLFELAFGIAGIAGVATAALTTAGSSPRASYETVIATSLALAFVATPVAVMLAGHLVGGRGDIVPAILGAVVGVAPGMAASGIVFALSDLELAEAALPGLAVAVALGLAGSCLGYELAHAEGQGAQKPISMPM